MNFDELLGIVSDRAESKNPDDFMDESAIVDLERLRLLAGPSIPGRHTDEENKRIFFTEWTAGRLHQRRWTHLQHADSDPNPEAAIELYRAILAYRALMETPAGPPPPLDVGRVPTMARLLFGPNPDPEMQGYMAYFLLSNAPADADRDYHALGVDLLRAAVDRISRDHKFRSEWLRVLTMADRQRRPPELDWEQMMVEETSRWVASAYGSGLSISQRDILANWDEVMGRLFRRLRTAMIEFRPELLDEEALSDARVLVCAIHSDAQRFDSSEFPQRVGKVYRLVGSMYNFRAATRTFEEGHADLARAILFLAMLDGDEKLPEPGGLLIGPGADPEAQGHYATLLLRQSRTAPDPALIAAAIVLLAGAMLWLADDAPEYAGFLANIATGFGYRYQRTGTRRDLDQAIVCAERSLARTSHHDPNLAGRRARLGTLYWDRALRTRVPADHNQAIRALESAVAAFAEDDPNLASHLKNLASAYHQRHVQQRHANRGVAADLADLDNAIALIQRALSASTTREVTEDALNSLGVAYFDRYRTTHDPVDLHEAAGIHERNLSALAPNDQMGLMIIANLALVYEERFTVDGTRVSSDVLQNMARQISSTRHDLPGRRLEACRHVGSLAAQMGEDGIATDLMRQAVQLLPLVVSPDNEWEDREQLVGKHFGLVEAAIAIHCRGGAPQGAIDMSELGRGLVLPVPADSHSDLIALEDQYPELATEFHRLRRTLARQHGALLGHTSEQLVGHRPFQPGDRVLWQGTYDRLLDQIRRIPGFTRFLFPPAPTQLRFAAEGGAVVLVNVDRLGGDAVVIHANGDPVHISLPNLELADVQTRGQGILDAVHFGTGRTGLLMKQRMLPEILRWLWITIVERVLAVLPPQPRIWWMPTGALTLFPLHAAGVPGQPDTLDLAVSSYTPTLRALASTRTRKAASVRRQLTVALERTPGLPDLPGVVREAEALRALHPDALHLRDGNATIERVLSALDDVTWAHFACHATADYITPSRGGLRLYDGILTIPDINPIHLRHAELAYLSACSTADRGVRHANESITVAAVFQTAGFRHVVASLWPLQDAHAAKVARSFYNLMPDTPTADAAPEVLRRVAIEHRTVHPDRPDLWASLIHLGP